MGNAVSAGFGRAKNGASFFSRARALDLTNFKFDEKRREARPRSLAAFASALARIVAHLGRWSTTAGRRFRRAITSSLPDGLFLIYIRTLTRESSPDGRPTPRGGGGGETTSPRVPLSRCASFFADGNGPSARHPRHSRGIGEYL